MTATQFGNYATKEDIQIMEGKIENKIGSLENRIIRVEDRIDVMEKKIENIPSEMKWFITKAVGSLGAFLISWPHIVEFVSRLGVKLTT